MSQLRSRGRAQAQRKAARLRPLKSRSAAWQTQRQIQEENTSISLVDAKEEKLPRTTEKNEGEKGQESDTTDNKEERYQIQGEAYDQAFAVRTKKQARRQQQQKQNALVLASLSQERDHAPAIQEEVRFSRPTATKATARKAIVVVPLRSNHGAILHRFHDMEDAKRREQEKTDAVSKAAIELRHQFKKLDDKHRFIARLNEFLHVLTLYDCMRNELLDPSTIVNEYVGSTVDLFDPDELHQLSRMYRHAVFSTCLPGGRGGVLYDWIKYHGKPWVEGYKEHAVDLFKANHDRDIIEVNRKISSRCSYRLRPDAPEWQGQLLTLLIDANRRWMWGAINTGDTPSTHLLKFDVVIKIVSYAHHFFFENLMCAPAAHQQWQNFSGFLYPISTSSLANLESWSAL